MTEFIKKIRLDVSPEANKVAFAKFGKRVHDTMSDFLPSFKIDSDSALPKTFNKFNKTLTTTVKEFDNLFEEVKDDNGNLLSFSEKLVMDFKNIGHDLIDTFISGFAKQIGKAFDEFDKMIDQSFLTNKTTRSNMFAYGFSTAESYGFEKTLGTMNIDKDDLMYMNEYQTNMFNELFKNYTDQYTKLADQGFFEKMQEYQLETQEFRDNFTYKVMEWIIHNKDKIMGFIDFSEKVLTIFLDVVSGIMDFFHISRSMPTETVPASDVISKYTGGDVSNQNININSTFNGVNMNNMTDVASTVGLSYEQLVQILLGG